MLTEAAKNMFVPEHYVPLSTFLDTLEPDEELALKVAPEILNYIQKHQLEITIAGKLEEKIEYIKPHGIDTEGGQVYFCAEKPGTYTVVSEAFQNSFPIVTHWDAKCNHGTGGFCIGASDAPGLLDINLEKGEILNENPIFDSDPLNPYTYQTTKYNLTSDASGSGTFKVPSFERYLGECFSLKRVTDILAIWISDKVLRETGYPLLYQNYPEQRLQSDIPVFQIINNYIIAHKPEESSLATFLLPPFWTKDPLKPYPAIFTGFYDNNDNFYLFSGAPFANIISKAGKETQTYPVGIIWNGGGSAGSRTFQLSAFHNLALLFDTAEDKFNIDQRSIVAVGGSRGGITTLMASGNPYHDNYRIRYAICSNPIIKLGYPDYDLANPTTPMIYSVMSDDTGYKYAWQKGWRDPESHLTGEELLRYNLIGTIEKNIANEVLSPLSKHVAKAMKERGTKLILYSGTHDAFNTKDSIIDLAETLLSQDVELELQLGYRYGHCNVEDLDQHAGQILIDMILEREINLKGVSHYKRASSNPEEWTKAEQFWPEHQPVFFEGPKKVVFGDRAAINIVGAAGMGYLLKLYSIDKDIWKNEKKILKLDQGRELFRGKLEEKTRYLEGRISYLNSYLDIDESFEEGMYLYEMWYTLENSQEFIPITAGGVPQPGVETEPILEIMKEYPRMSGSEFAQAQNVFCIGWGLSEY